MIKLSWNIQAISTDPKSTHLNMVLKQEGKELRVYELSWDR